MTKLCIRTIAHAILPLWLCAGSPAIASANPQESSEKVLKVGSELDFPPYALVNENGEADGYSVDLLKAVAEEVGLKLDIKAAPWAEIRRDLEMGNIDVLPFVAWSVERDQKLDFTSTHVTVHDNIFRRKGDLRIRSEADLKGKTVLVMEGDSAHDYLKRTKFAGEIQITKTLYQALILLNAGVGDAVICERVAGLLAIRDNNLTSVEALTAPLGAYIRNFAFAVKEGNSQLLAKLELGLAAIRINGKYQEIYNKWLQSITPADKEAAIAKRNARISLFTASVASLLGAFALMGIVFLWGALRRKGQSLNETNETFYQILDSIPDLVLLKGPQSRIVWGNKAFRNYYGMSLQQIENMVDAPFSPPDHTLQYVKDDAWVFENGKPLNIDQEPVTRHDGEIHYFHTIKAPLFDSFGRVYRTVGVSRDITERLQQEKLFAEQQARMVSVSKMSALGEMAGGIAHEINNPLMVVSLKAERLLKRALAGDINNEIVVDYAQKIFQTAKRIAAIVNALKATAREGSSDSFEFEKIDKIVQDTIELCKDRFRHNNVQLNIEICPGEPMLECRQVEISQILLNLLNNAFDAVAEHPKKSVSLTVKEVDDCLEIDVVDSGPGIPLEVREKLMKPFFTTKGIGKGTGLGLSISKGIAESHGGSLLLDLSSPQTRFVLRLPKSQKKPAVQEKLA